VLRIGVMMATEEWMLRAGININYGGVMWGSDVWVGVGCDVGWKM